MSGSTGGRRRAMTKGPSLRRRGRSYGREANERGASGEEHTKHV